MRFQSDSFIHFFFFFKVLRDLNNYLKSVFYWFLWIISWDNTNNIFFYHLNEPSVKSVDDNIMLMPIPSVNQPIAWYFLLD